MQNKFLVWILFVGFVGILIHSGCEKKIIKPQGTVHGHYINRDETWRAEGNPHIIDGVLFVGVDSAAILTIEPGVIVKIKRLNSVENGSLFIGSHGSLIANGTNEQPISFTSNETSPRAGDWGYVYLYTDEPRHSILNNCIIEYGGEKGLLSIASLYVHCRLATITNCTIRNSKTSGIDIAGVDDSLTFAGNVITQNGEAGIAISGRVNTVTVVENTISENAGSGVDFGITARCDSLSFLNNAIMQNGGSGVNFSGEANFFTFEENTISENGGSGIDFNGEVNSLTFEENTIGKNGGSGVNFGLGAEVNSLIFAGNVVTQNGSYPIQIYSLEHIFGFSKDNDLLGNVVDEINVVGAGLLSRGGVLPNLGLPYIMSDLYVDSDTGAFLTIEPGCLLKFDRRIGDGRLSVSLLGHGTLVANGTFDKPIIFTSADLTPEPGDWRGIQLYSSTQNSILNYCVIEYGGFPVYPPPWYPFPQAGNIYIDATSPTISNCIIRNSAYWGIYVGSGSPIIQNNTFSDNYSGDIGP